MVKVGWWKAQFMSRFLFRMTGVLIDPEMLQCAVQHADASWSANRPLIIQMDPTECADDEYDALCDSV
jgi:hypothetical protein